MVVGCEVVKCDWIVIFEVLFGCYMVVSFVSGFNVGMSVICFVCNGNFGVFDGVMFVVFGYMVCKVGW